MFIPKTKLLFVAIALSAGSAIAPAMADATDVELYAQQPVMTGARLSPDGTQVAFLSSLQGRYHVVIEKFQPSFSRAVVAPTDKLDFDWVHWANNDRLILLASYSGSWFSTETRESRLLAVNADGSEIAGIIKPAKAIQLGGRVAKELPSPQIQNKVVDWLPSEPNHILVAVDSDFNGHDEVRRVDISNGNYREVLGDFAGDRTWVTDQTGKIRLGWEWENDNLEMMLQDADGDWYTADEDWLRGDFVPLVFSEDPNVLLVVGPNDVGLDVIRTLRLDTGEFLETIFESEHVDAGGVVIDDLSGVPIGVSYTEHVPSVMYFDEEYRKLQATINRALPDTTNQIVSASEARRQILIFSSSDSSPGAYFIWDRDAKDLSHYSDYMPGLGEESMSPVIPVSFEARDGLEIPAYLTIPRGADASNLPAVILPHGGPHSRDDKGYWFLSQFLASRGYVILQPNFRGSSGYGDSFAAAGRSEWGGKMQDDVTDGARWLLAEGIADPDRMCIVGWSYGGYAAAMGAVKTPSLYRCAASINGVLNLPLHIVEDQKYIGGREWTKHMGLEGEKSRAVSPYHQADKVLIPMLIIQSEDDTRVHNDQGRGMANRLRALGKSVEYVEIEFGGHSMRNVEGRKKILESLEAFLAKSIE